MQDTESVVIGGVHAVQRHTRPRRWTAAARCWAPRALRRRSTFAGYARLLTGCATSDTSTSSTSSPQVSTPLDGCAACASTTSGCSRSTNRHPHTRRRRRQERPDRRRDGRPLGARRQGHTIPKRPTRSSNRSGFVHHASERRQGPQRGDGPALPADHHRAPAATRTARRASLDPRQGDAVSPAATRPQQDQAGDDPLPEALHRARDAAIIAPTPRDHLRRRLRRANHQKLAP